jgi:agmatinase
MNFGAFPDTYTRLSDSQIVLLPLPYDGTTTWIKGADKGPAAIIEASANLEWYDIETGTEIYRKGIHTAKPIPVSDNPEKMVDDVYRAVKKYLEMDKFTIPIGGEHSLTIGSVKAHAEKHPGLSVLQFDAHSDLRNSYLDSSYNHACTMARVKEMAPILQVGIRSMDVSELPEFDITRAVYAHEIVNKTPWQEKILSRVTDKTYITIDLDVLDPAVMPSTGTPEPGGLSYYDILNFICRLKEKTRIIGFDVMELCPNQQNKAPDFTAAKLIYQILSMLFG